MKRPVLTRRTAGRKRYMQYRLRAENPDMGVPAACLECFKFWTYNFQKYLTSLWADDNHTILFAKLGQLRYLADIIKDIENFGLE